MEGGGGGGKVKNSPKVHYVIYEWPLMAKPTVRKALLRPFTVYTLRFFAQIFGFRVLTSFFSVLTLVGNFSPSYSGFSTNVRMCWKNLEKCCAVFKRPWLSFVQICLLMKRRYLCLRKSGFPLHLNVTDFPKGMVFKSISILAKAKTSLEADMLKNKMVEIKICRN